MSLADGVGAAATCAVPLLEIPTTRERDRPDAAPLESVAFTYIQNVPGFAHVWLAEAVAPELSTPVVVLFPSPQ